MKVPEIIGLLQEFEEMERKEWDAQDLEVHPLMASGLWGRSAPEAALYTEDGTEQPLDKYIVVCGGKVFHGIAYFQDCRELGKKVRGVEFDSIWDGYRIFLAYLALKLETNWWILEEFRRAWYAAEFAELCNQHLPPLEGSESVNDFRDQLAYLFNISREKMERVRDIEAKSSPALHHLFRHGMVRVNTALHFANHFSVQEQEMIIKGYTDAALAVHLATEIPLIRQIQMYYQAMTNKGKLEMLEGLASTLPRDQFTSLYRHRAEAVRAAWMLKEASREDESRPDPLPPSERFHNLLEGDRVDGPNYGSDRFELFE